MCGPLLRRFLGRHLMLCLGLGIVLVMSLAALCAPLLAPYDPNALHLDHILEPPSSMFWLGTDRLGRDVFSRLLYGGWLTGRQNPIQARITQLTLGNISRLYENVAPEYRDYVMNYCYMGGNALIIQWIRNKFDLEPETVARMSVTFSALITQYAIAHPFREEKEEG